MVIILDVTDEDYARWMKLATEAEVDSVAEYIIQEMEYQCFNMEMSIEHEEQLRAEADPQAN